MLVGKELELYQMAMGFHQAYDKLRDNWRTMFLFVRENNLSPERVDGIFAAAGFNRQRASEMRRVCATDDHTAKLYASKQIGFRVVLDIERAKGKKGKSKKGSGVASRLRQKTFDSFSKAVLKGVIKPYCTTMNEWALIVVPFKDSPTSLTSPADVVVTHIDKLVFTKQKGK